MGVLKTDFLPELSCCESECIEMHVRSAIVFTIFIKNTKYRQCKTDFKITVLFMKLYSVTFFFLKKQHTKI